MTSSAFDSKLKVAFVHQSERYIGPLTSLIENAELLFPAVVEEFYKTAGKHNSNASDAFRVLTIYSKDLGTRVMMTCTIKGSAQVAATGGYQMDVKDIGRCFAG